MFFKKICIFLILLHFSISSTFAQSIKKDEYNSKIGINIFSYKESRISKNRKKLQKYPRFINGISYKWIGKKVNLRFSISYFIFDYEAEKISQFTDFGTVSDLTINKFVGNYGEIVPAMGIEKEINLGKKLKWNIGFDFSILTARDTFSLHQIQEFTGSTGQKIFIETNSSQTNKFTSISVIPMTGFSYQIRNRLWIAVETSLMARVNFNSINNFLGESSIDSLDSHFDPISFLGIYYDLNL